MTIKILGVVWMVILGGIRIRYFLEFWLVPPSVQGFDIWPWFVPGRPIVHLWVCWGDFPSVQTFVDSSTS